MAWAFNAPTRRGSWLDWAVDPDEFAAETMAAAKTACGAFETIGGRSNEIIAARVRAMVRDAVERPGPQHGAHAHRQIVDNFGHVLNDLQDQPHCQ